VAEDVHVVIVDDVVDVAQAMATALALDGYQVRTAHSGEEALRVVAEHPPLCVLLDIDMPGMGGAELSRQLRERYGYGMVLIAMTGLGDEAHQVTQTLSRVDHFLRKPVDPERVRKLLKPVKPPA